MMTMQYSATIIDGAPRLGKRQPRIAVVIPCFNDGRTLPAAVRSTFQQEACETVVVDDGSTDSDTMATLKDLAQAGVRVVHQQNEGQASARMTGVRSTSARYIFPLDADDFLLPHSLTTLANYLDSHSDVGLAWGRYRFAGEKTHEHDVPATLDPWLITYFNDLPVATMVRRDTLLAVDGWQPPNGYEDWNLWMSLAESGVAGRGLDVVVYCHRLHGVRQRLSSVRRHDELYGSLRSQHAALFASRTHHRRQSDARLAVKAVVPLVYRIRPLTLYQRMSLAGGLYRVLSGQASLCAGRATLYAAFRRSLPRFGVIETRRATGHATTGGSRDG